MNRDQLAHILRAASTIVDDPEILIIGSQSVLGSFAEGRLPEEALGSMEVDLAYLHDDDTQKADAVDGVLGELSQFHETFGIYAQGVAASTAVLPAGWRDRLVSWSGPATGTARAVFLEPHDCVVSKLVAFREKDQGFAAALLNAGLVDPTVLLQRITSLPAAVDPRLIAVLRDWVERASAQR